MESKGFRRESVRAAGCEISLKASTGYDLWHRTSLASARFDIVAAYRFSRRKQHYHLLRDFVLFIFYLTQPKTIVASFVSIKAAFYVLSTLENLLKRDY